MGPTRSPDRHRARSRWASSRRSPTPQDAATLRASLDAHQPGFLAAVVADTRVTARFRGERHEFASSAAALSQALRLAWITDSFLAQICYRAKVACRARGVPVLPHLLDRVAATTGQVSIGDHVVMRPGVYLPHGQVVIDGITYVGSDVVLRPFVTLGLRDGEMFGPHIGDGTKIGTGAKVFGPITIGSDVQIGANAVVNDDVPDGATAVGVPARVLGRRGSSPVG